MERRLGREGGVRRDHDNRSSSWGTGSLVLLRGENPMTLLISSNDGTTSTSVFSSSITTVALSGVSSKEITCPDFSARFCRSWMIMFCDFTVSSSISSSSTTTAAGIYIIMN